LLARRLARLEHQIGFVVIEEFDLDKAEKPKAQRSVQNSSDCAHCNHPQHNVASDGKRR
jgi:hypothetical protein